MIAFSLANPAQQTRLGHRRSAGPWAVLLLALHVSGCTSGSMGPDTGMDPPALNIPAGCNPLAADYDCLLPYPSDFFLTSDATMPTGKRLRITEAAALRTRRDTVVDFTLTHPVDGFSHHQPLLVHFPQGVSTEGVVFHTDDPQRSLQPKSKVVILDAETGQPIPVWAEVDLNTSEPSEQAFIIRTFERLKNSHRYIVALQDLLSPAQDAKAAAPLPAPSGFARLRDRQAGSTPALQALAARYESDIFPALARFGIERSRLQLAWDFTTSSETVNTRDMETIRADVLPKLQAKAPVVTVASVVENDPMKNPNIWLRVEGTIRVPLYLDSDAVGAKLHRDARGQVLQNGEAEVPFTLQVPHSAKPADMNFEPARILQYGHGFFGLREEINYSFMRGYTNEGRYVAVAVDWWGMSEPDLDQVTQDAVNAPGTAFDFVDRLQQAMVNMMALSYAVKGSLPQVPELRRFGKPLFDPDKLYYYGISQGAIFGVTMLSLNPVLDRAVLGVGGGPYSLMMSRSASYEMLYGLLTTQLPTALSYMKFMSLSQSTWDRVDPVTYAPRLLQRPYPGSPANRHLLMQIGIGDHSVNNLASHVVARAVGVPLFDPSPTPIWGLPSVSAPADDALVLVDFKLAPDKIPGIYCRLPTASEKNGVHEGVRRHPKIKQQIDQFFQPTGQIQNTCAGPCVP
jgi:hypothetical protein